ncbi:MAG TPA: diguanylate cyclase, partial [Anaerolineales bacterium]|nr:diguanylate cyclase [Anaerolineales bacterium]
VLEAGEALVIEDVRDSPYFSRGIIEEFPIVSMLALPMISNGRKLGAVFLGFAHRHQFNQDEIIISEQATNLVALVMAKLQAVEQSRRRAAESETLRRAGAAVAETLDMQEATTRILQQLAHVLPYDSASVQILQQGELEIIGGEGFKSSVIGMRFPAPGDNPNTVVLQTRRPYLLHEANKFFPAFRQPPHDHIRSWLGVPLIVRDQLIGLLAIDSTEPHHFTSADIELASAFADHVAVAIENARLFNETQRLAITDGLTGLFNRRHFLELAGREFERARRYKRYLSAMIFDIDRFKNINDTYGHQTGDEVLRALADLCRDKLREADTLGRYGGEEFVGLFIETDGESARKVADRLRGEVEKMDINTGEGRLKITVSIGIAEQTENTPDVETLIARADQAMYIAKHKGRNRVAISI